MADSAFLSRLPVRGAVFQSTGINDAFKVPLLDAEGKIHFSLLSNSATIYAAENTVDRLDQTAATPGDFCVQEDNNSIYFLKVSPPTVENNWIRLSTVEDSEQDFDSPNFTGIPTAPTASPETSTIQVATTEFVHSLVGASVPVQDEASGAIGESFKYAREDHKHPTDISRAPLASPIFTGSPTAPTPEHTDNSTRTATTAFVKSQSFDEFTPARGNINVNNWRITSLGSPINASDAVHKGYVDALQSGLTVRTPVRGATTIATGNISLVGNVNAVDGISLVNGDRVLVKNQINPSQNGIYVVAIGAPWQRAADADSSAEMKNGVYVFVLEGNTNKDSAWVLITAGNIVLNVTPLNFVYFTNQNVNQMVAGEGLVRNLNTFSIDSAVVATLTGLATKEDSIPAGTSAQYWRGDKSWQALDKAAVGLGDVDNTTDANKPVSSAAQTALDLKLNSLDAIATYQPIDTDLTAIAALNPANDDFLQRKNDTWAKRTISEVKLDLGINNVDNTADTAKPVSSATQTALNLKLNLVAITEALGAKYKGLYDNESAYAVDDVVQYDGGLYRRILPATPGYSPADTTYWVAWNLNNKLVEKQDALVSATNIKTVGGTSLLGAGNVAAVSAVNVIIPQNDIVKASTSVDETVINISLSSKYDTAIADNVSSVSVGGATAQLASDWKNKNIVQVLDTILFPDVPPTYTNPTLTLSFNPTLVSVYEVGQNLSTVVTLSAVKNDAGDFSGAFSIARSGESGSSSDASAPVQGSAPDVSSQFTYPNPNNPNKSWIKTWAQNLSLALGNTSWTGTASQGYAAGAAKKNNKGIVDTRSSSVRSPNAPQAASASFSSASVSVNAIYPWFWGKSSSQPTKASIAATIASGGTNRKLETANGVLGITFAATNEFIWFALPTGAPTKTKWYVNETNQGNIEATGLFASAGITQAVDAPLVSPETVRRWNGVQYQIYISNFATTTSGAMQLRET